MAHKVEHAVDLESGALAGVKVPDTETLEGTLQETSSVRGADRACGRFKGYHSDATMVGMKRAGVRSYVSEPRRGRRRWKGKVEAASGVCEPASDTRCARVG